MKRIFIFAFLIFFILNSFAYAEFTKEYMNDPNCLPDYRTMKCFNGTKIVSKPTSKFAIKNIDSGDYVESYSGKNCNEPLPEINSTIGDTIEFIDLSQPSIDLKSWDFQYYGAEGNSYNIYNANPLNNKKIKLSKLGKTTFYLAVLSNDVVSNSILPWSDNGDHQTIGPKTSSFPDGLFWYFTAITVNTVPATPTPTPTPTPIISTPVAPSGVIKFDPPECEWRNSDIPVRVYVDGSTTTTKQDSDIRSYSWSYTVYPSAAPGEPEPTPYTSHDSSSTFWTFTQNWSIDRINVNGKQLIKSPETINNNDKVIVTKEGFNNLNAALTGWNAGSKSWVSGSSPRGSWSSGEPSANTSEPSDKYGSSSGYYKVDKTDPLITYDWSNQDTTVNGIHTFYYVPGQKINFTLSDNLSGVRAIRYKWTDSNIYPDINSMQLENFTTSEITQAEYNKGQNPAGASYSVPVHEGAQPRIGLYYLHTYVIDRAGNSIQNTVPVNIRVDLFDFRITSITDLSWEDVFRNTVTKVPTGSYYPVSLMPVAQHPTKKVVPKKGYAFEFSIKSHGLNDMADSIIMTPRFYWCKSLDSQNIANAQEVDLYYDLGKDLFIKYGEKRDTYMLKQKVNNVECTIGGFSGLKLTGDVKSILNTKTQSWVGKYGLQQSTLAAVKGTSIIKNGIVDTASLIKTGYILINFKIDAYKGNRYVFCYKPDDTLKNDAILKINNVPDQWTVEGGPRKIIFNGGNIFYPGDTIFFNNLYSAKDDYQINTDR